MRRIKQTPRLGSEDGATAVIVAILALVLLGLAALALDIGHLMWERSRLQNSADAGALAAAQELATGADEGTGEATAGDYVLRNNPRGAHLDDYEIDNEEQSVTVTAGTGDSDGNEDQLTTWFASVIGIDSMRSAASATAVWGADGGALPLTFSTCDLMGLHGDGEEEELPEVSPSAIKEHVDSSFPKWDDFEESEAGSPTRITLHEAGDEDACTISPGFSAQDGDKMPAGFGWLDLDLDENSCATRIEGGEEFSDGEVTYNAIWAGSKGGTYPEGLSCLAEVYESGQPAAIPIFIDFEGPPRKEYLLIAPASFYVTGYRIPGPHGGAQGEGTAAGGPDGCTGSEWCVDGYFVRNVKGSESVWDTAPLGAGTVRLTD